MNLLLFGLFGSIPQSVFPGCVGFAVTFLMPRHVPNPCEAMFIGCAVDDLSVLRDRGTREAEPRWQRWRKFA